MNIKFLNNFGEHKAPTLSIPIAYLITSSIELVNNQKILFLSLWSQRNRKEKADYKVYLYDGGYVSQRLEDEDGTYKWSIACLENLVGYYYQKNKILCDRLQDRERIETFFKVNLKVGEEYNIIDKFQKGLMDEKLNIKHKKITDVIDKAMLKVGTLPKNFENWVYNSPFGFSRYIYYKRKGKNISGYCTECKKDFVITETKLTKKNIKHNNNGTCPKCNKKIEYKAIGKTTQLQDRAEFAIMQKYEKGFIVRYFSGSISYMEHYKNPIMHYYETIREIYTPNNNFLIIKKYEYNEFLQTGITRWCDDSRRREVPKAYFYTRNLKSILADTKWKYSCMYDYAKEVKFLFADVFLIEYLKHPTIEYFIKAKLFKFVDDNLSYYNSDWNGINFEAKKIKDIFGMDMKLFQQMQRLNLGNKGLTQIKKVSEMGKTITDLQLKWLDNNLSDFGYFNKMYQLTTANQIIKYVKTQVSSNHSAYNILSAWCDYIVQCRNLEFDLNNTFILYPQNLLEKHEELNLMCEVKKTKKLNDGIKNVFKVVNEKYSFSNKKNLTIRTVANVSELVAEGQKQRHCVGGMGYAGSMAKGDIAIMVIRAIKEPNKSFYTLELNLKTKKVVQCRGFKNCDMTLEVKKFVESWKNKILSKKDKRVRVKISA
ncbi:PcfJ domain-containing protein [Clostridium estertheticum]|uniref:PcfJ domain-containing protein n=1 Tax=Clostridium estertheticum TaxID=238834 RepID=UPI001C7D7FBC|nr:PcfJ domain-containing protein [Clostridium estertheticum]MBX4267153.1 PcfJ domain-containing protein [Clostridium estertheticum]MBX4272018.1 PcfJ domain-containing protein [Clostridium estertheticum]WLC82403.1 PcfJ domain-containing protein [Clostridium estertheticum]WLC91276.1 PcfJ domain-containing protein [Clostridium estertheticum]